MSIRFFMLLAAWLLPCLVQAQMIMHRSGSIPDQYLVSFVGGAPDLHGNHVQAIMRAKADLQSHVQHLKEDLSDTDLQVLRQLWMRNAVAVRLSARYRSRLESLSYVAGVRPDVRYRVEPQGVVNLPVSGVLAQDNLQLINIDQLWADGFKGQGVVVAILDTGVDLNHADLGKRWRGGSNSWFDPFGEFAQPSDTDPRDNGHGTAVTSLILGGDATGAFIGVAPDAEWIAARIFDSNRNSSESTIISALQWVADPDGNPLTDDAPDIVHNSWGLSGTEGQCINPFTTELSALAALGIDVVFAIGNSGPSASGTATYLTPAFDPNVIAIGAVESDGKTIWYNSSRGPDQCGSSVIPYLVAPGAQIKAASQTYGLFPDSSRVFSGTSFSAPQVTGVMALLRSRFMLDRATLLKSLSATAVDLGTPGVDSDFGYGLVQAWPAAQQLMADPQVKTQQSEVAFSSANYVVGEGDGSVDVVVLRHGDLSQQVSVLLTSKDGSATNGKDYTAQLQTLTFLPGEYRKVISIVLLEDALEEGDETFTLYLTSNTNVNIGARNTKQVLIKDNDVTAPQDKIGGASLSGFMLLLLGLLGLFRKRVA